MIEPHWHKWLSGDEWAKMGPFPDEQACPYCRTEKAEARAKKLKEALREIAHVRSHDHGHDPQDTLDAAIAIAERALRGEEER
jgi:hypothetical protein